jgi:glutamate/tyrosine decarboxylase-like PLP-dependent enzyme
MRTLPTRGISKDALFAELEQSREGDVRWREGRAYGFAYDAGRETEEVGKEAFARFVCENALDPTALPSARRLENEVVAMAASHLGGADGVTGSFTSGGTESILCAVKAAREHACKARPGLARPNLVLPVTAHAAFHKAAHYLGLDVIAVDVDPRTLKADVAAMARAVTDETALLVGSAPCWPYGVVDPIPELAALAQEKGVLLHVDACVGGFLLPYFRRLGATHPPFDFRVPGVTSISMDLHKFAFVPKGASVVLYREASLRRHQMFAFTDWPGYTIVNPVVQSSRSAGPIASAWAVLQFVGEEGYLELSRRVLEGVRRLLEGIRRVGGLEVMGRPEFALVAASSPEVSVFHVADEMKARGWDIQVQLSFRDLPANLHFLVTPGNAGRVDEMLVDLRDAVRTARSMPSSPLRAALGDLTATLDPSTWTAETLDGLLSMVGIRGANLPSRRAEIHELLDALPRSVCRELVTEYFQRLFTPAA